ncbi:MAG: hypothetical protein AB1778_06110 [Candidatus Bipolaricaulota bacterium]
MVRVYLYGKLRRFAADSDPRTESICDVPAEPGDTVGTILKRLGIPLEAVGANLFVNGHYADLATGVADGARVGVFPEDMQLLYKWYFRAESGPA